MSRKDISDLQVVQAYQEYADRDQSLPVVFATEILALRTGQCAKVAYAAAERADRRGLIEWGVSMRSGWLTDKGRELLKSAGQEKP